MVSFKFIVTRQLTAYSGSDKYLNLNAIDEIQQLYDGIINNTIISVNDTNVEAIPARNIVKFNIKDKILNKSFPIHIKKSHDGLRFTLTEYVNAIKMSPNSILILSINFINDKCYLYIKNEYYYKYILEKNSSENIYRILIENPPSNRIGTTECTDIFLRNFNIINTHRNDLNWRGSQSFQGYQCTGYNKKYIGVPYSTELELDEFDSIEEVL